MFWVYKFVVVFFMFCKDKYLFKYKLCIDFGFMIYGMYLKKLLSLLFL